MARKNWKNALATRKRILEVATRSFARRGIANTRLADVAASAGVTRGAIYHHFGSREALLDAVIERAPWPPLAVERPPAGHAVERPLESLRRAMAQALVRILSRPADRGVAEILLFQPLAGTARASRHDQARRECVVRIAAWLALAVQSGELPARFDLLRASWRMHASLVGLVAQQLATSRETEHLIGPSMSNAVISS
jgi:TetR/AcrR family acrAB operon transcriptional repressor